MRIKISNLGCRLNQYEIQSVSTRLQDMGHTVVQKGDADVYIINSCAVTLHSERKTRKLIYRAQREIGHDRDRLIIVTGCAAGEVHAEENVLYVPNDFKYLVPELVVNRNLFTGLERKRADRFAFRTPLKTSTTRVNLKIQDGCDNFCSYCIIPYVRGLPVSRPFDDVMKEFRELVDGGYKEIVLAGIQLGKYIDGDRDLAALLTEMLESSGDFRVHLSSLSPDTVNDRIIELACHPKLVKHLNLSLQSGSDKVLNLMKRKYNRRTYISIVEKIRKNDPLFNFTTDLIVGFPGESDADFNESLKVVKEAGFSHIHTFRFSRRPGTEAENMKGTVSEEEKSVRSAQVISLYMEQKRIYYETFNDEISRILTEKPKSGKGRGFNEYYVPVELESCEERNRFINVQTKIAPSGDYLTGIPV